MDDLYNQYITQTERRIKIIEFYTGISNEIIKKNLID